jgi:hypothetical protein
MEVQNGKCHHEGQPMEVHWSQCNQPILIVVVEYDLFKHEKIKALTTIMLFVKETMYPMIISIRDHE